VLNMDGSGEEENGKHKKRPGLEALFHCIHRDAMWQRLWWHLPDIFTVKVREKTTVHAL